MFEEKFDIGPVTLARGAPTTFYEQYAADFDAQRRTENILSNVYQLERFYDQRIDDIKKATGLERPNPIRDWQLPGLGPSRGDRIAAFDEWLKGVEQQFPEHAGVIRGSISPDMEARQDTQRSERRADDMATRYDGARWVPALLGGFHASLYDPTNVLAMMAGPWGRAGAGAAGVFWMGVKSGAANMAVEAASQPVVQKWRKDAGLDYGLSRAALQVGAAGVFGFGLDAGLRGAYRVIQHSRGREAILDPAGNVMGYRAKGAPEDALEEAAKEASPNAMIRKAADGDIDAIHSIARDAGISTDPAIRGARAAAEIEREIAPKLPEGLDPEDGFERMVQTMRAAVDPREPIPVAAPPLAKPRPDLADDTALPVAAGKFAREGKPVTLERIDPRTIATDPSSFQFKRGGDGQGEIGTLAGVETWDPMASNRVIVFERADGTRIIADGHQRLGLARRLADQDPILDGFVMREADGWTVADVRAYAAQKNLKEGSGSIVDAATVIRERPDIIDGSVPLNNGAMRQARALSRLSDEAFGQVVAGNVDPVHASLVADLVGDKALHAGFLDELIKARPDNLRQARIMIGDMLEAGNAHEVQQTLFGIASFQRPMMAERAAVLDRALKTLGEDAKIFGLVDREADRLRGAGNRIARGNADRAQQAENIGEIIERLARRAGPVSEWLGDAARAVDAGMAAKDAADAFVSRLRREIGDGGLAALEREAAPAAGLDDPGAKGTAPLADAMERNFDLLLKDMKAVAEGKPSRDQEVMFAIRAFHSSPHDFDRFDMSKIGTGEGAQVFGNGLYFAESQKVSGKDGHYYNVFKGKFGDAHAYEVNIKANPEDFLDWDKPISQQSEKIRQMVSEKTSKTHYWNGQKARSPLTNEILVRIMHMPGSGVFTPEGVGVPRNGPRFSSLRDAQTYVDEVLAKAVTPLDMDKMTGRTLAETLAGEGVPSKWLATDYGIPGVRYLDQGSREAGDGTYNYVVFDDSLIEIVAKDGKPVSKAERDDVMMAMRRGRNETGAGAVSAPEAQAKRAAVDAALLKGEFGHTARATADMDKIRADVTAAVRKVAPRDVGVRVRDAITEYGQGVEGYFDPHERLIHIALTAGDPMRVGLEEAGHALKRSGLFTADEYRLLADYAARHDLRTAFDIEARYMPVYGKRWEGDKARIEAALVEETVMQMLARHATGERWGAPAEQTIVAKLVERFWKVINAVKAALGARGVRSVDDVFRAFEAGEIGARRSRGTDMQPINIREIGPTDPHPGPVEAYHATFADFGKFRVGQREFGIHFGTAKQAETRALDVAEMARQSPNAEARRAIAPSDPRTIPVVLDIKRPLDLPDLGDWSARNTIRAIKAAGVDVDEAALRHIDDVLDDGDHDLGLDEVARVLDRAGYDGIRYQNGVEGAGWSYIAFKQNTVRAAYDPDHVWFARARQQIDGIKDAADLVGACKHS